MINKVFGIISYFPNNDSDYHIETRRERSRRCRELLFMLEELWPDIDIMIIAQNWQDFDLPKIKNNMTVFYYDKLGILGARRELRRRFLNSKYDYLIMLDDDAMIASQDPDLYMQELDKHPDGVGTLRKNQSPLQLFAISKYIYNQIDMPDIDAEKGEGFEDDVFVAQCFSRFPDHAFIFPDGIISETSFKYTGVGSCPSTWAKEKKYDWKHMREFTRNTVSVLQTPIVEISDSNAVADRSIDLLITYVNGSDRQWINDYIKYTKTRNPTAVRFRSWGTLKYLFRGIDTYMPFIRNIVLILARQSQVPVWVNKDNVRIVYHEDFIPKQHLPTFNSCTIESFFWNIPDLTDKVIYFNDDMFPIRPLSVDDFFTGDLPNIKFTEPESYSERTIFRAQCRSSIDLITNVLGLPKFKPGKIVRPYHISSSITKDSMQAISSLCKDAIGNVATMLRNPKNVNQYIYLYYHYFTGNYVDKTVDYKYFELNESNISNIINAISNGEHKMVCLNDSDKLKDYARVRYLLQTCFERKFPTKCRYEI